MSSDFQGQRKSLYFKRRPSNGRRPFCVIITGYVTVGTWESKIICADRVPVGLSYDANFKWHMPI